jgi:hypothetical protein
MGITAVDKERGDAQKVVDSLKQAFADARASKGLET